MGNFKVGDIIKPIPSERYRVIRDENCVLNMKPTTCGGRFITFARNANYDLLEINIIKNEVI